MESELTKHQGPGEASIEARDRAREAEQTGAVVGPECGPAKVAQAIVDVGVRLIGATFGVFVYSRRPGDGELQYAASGLPDGSRLPALLGGSELFAQVLRGEGVVRLADATEDPRGASHVQHDVMPPGVPVLRSCLAAPVASPDGDVLGGMLFGNPEQAKFTPEHEQMIAGLAKVGAIAVECARPHDAGRLAGVVNAELAAIVQSSDDAIVSKNLDGIVRSWNAGAERMFGYTPAEMIGRSITQLIPADRPNEEPSILARLRRGERVDHFETVRVRKDGRRIDVSVTISPIRDSSGQIVGASKVAREITERKRIEIEREQLLAAERAARGEAERHSRMKDEFLATLGHELRTPLNAVLGWATLLKRHKIQDEEVTHGLDVIERNARLQGQLVEDLLDMSRIVSGKLRLNVQPVDLSSVIDAAMEAISPAAHAKTVRLERVLDPLAGPVSGDANRLQQIVWNLLSNAVKFTPKGGRVHVLLERVNSHVEISITDTGQGIAPDFLPHVFDRFRQADASTTRQYGGLGLGLAIVKHLTELHGGTVRVKSAGVGLGAAFTVALPMRPAHRDEPGTAFGAGAGHVLQEVLLAGVRAVVVDDEPDARDLLRRVLQEAHVSVEIASSAEEAVRLVSAKPPDVLISDIGMPGEDGYSLIRRIRALPQEQGRDIPAIALTAFARPDDRRRALLSGFQMHVPKPVEAAELLAVIASVTRRV